MSPGKWRFCPEPFEPTPHPSSAPESHGKWHRAFQQTNGLAKQWLNRMRPARVQDREDEMTLSPKLLMAALAALALTLPSGRASADPSPTAAGPAAGAKKAAEERKALMKDRKEALKERRNEVKDELKEKRDEKKEELKEKRDEKKEELKEKRDELKEKWAKLRETRKERRKERREEIKKKWGDLSGKPAVRAELKVHAWRMARLNRIRAIAKAEGKDAVVERADKLIEKEKARHDKHMEGLKAKGGEQ